MRPMNELPATPLSLDERIDGPIGQVCVVTEVSDRLCDDNRQPGSAARRDAHVRGPHPSFETCKIAGRSSFSQHRAAENVCRFIRRQIGFN